MVLFVLAHRMYISLKVNNFGTIQQAKVKKSSRSVVYKPKAICSWKWIVETSLLAIQNWLITEILTMDLNLGKEAASENMKGTNKPNSPLPPKHQGFLEIKSSCFGIMWFSPRQSFKKFKLH